MENTGDSHLRKEGKKGEIVRKRGKVTATVAQRGGFFGHGNGGNRGGNMGERLEHKPD